MSHRFGPYAPSNRAALNVLHIAQIPHATAASRPVDRLARRRRRQTRALCAPLSSTSTTMRRLHQFRAEVPASAWSATRSSRPSPPRLAAAQPLGAWTGATGRPPIATPNNPAVPASSRKIATKSNFHAWLQYRAGPRPCRRAAGRARRRCADRPHRRSRRRHRPWRQRTAGAARTRCCKGLEIGAPPDSINREGQSWGITAFSPRGLRNSGFSAFIEMLRHALRHAGGVRIDHVMGLARLWVIPAGFPSAAGAYLAMPVDDLMRLVTLESQRHQAVILGEDLGTLPHGFGPSSNAAGIAGLRVMWFERAGQTFQRRPQTWTPTAVAMTTTHDLPTVAGWWEGPDIDLARNSTWRATSEPSAPPTAPRLWSAFRQSGATAAPQPPAHDGAAATYAAAAHLGRAACTLALLPIEDALSLPEQPNLPGTHGRTPQLAPPPAGRRRDPVRARGFQGPPRCPRRGAQALRSGSFLKKRTKKLFPFWPLDLALPSPLPSSLRAARSAAWQSIFLLNLALRPKGVIATNSHDPKPKSFFGSFCSQKEQLIPPFAGRAQFAYLSPNARKGFCSHARRIRSLRPAHRHWRLRQER